MIVLLFSQMLQVQLIITQHYRLITLYFRFASFNLAECHSLKKHSHAEPANHHYTIFDRFKSMQFQRKIYFSGGSAYCWTCIFLKEFVKRAYG